MIQMRIFGAMVVFLVLAIGCAEPRSIPSATNELAVLRDSAAPKLVLNPIIPPEPTKWRIVQRGETFFSIANEIGSTVEKLMSLNPLVMSDSIQVGGLLRVPITGKEPPVSIVPSPPGKPVKPTIRPRSAWAGRWTQHQPIRRNLKRVTGGFREISFHHAAMSYRDTSPAVEFIRAMYNEKIKHGYGDVPYHFLIDNEGGIWEGRSTQFEDASIYKRHKGMLSVSLQGTFTRENGKAPSQAQLDSMIHLIAWLCREHRIEPDKRHVFSHDEDVARRLALGENIRGRSIRTEDPGNVDKDDIRKRVATLLDKWRSEAN